MARLKLLGSTMSAIILAAMQMIAIIFITLLIMTVMLGDPVLTIAGMSGGLPPSLISEWRHIYGLDLPLPTRLITYVGRVLQGDFGNSYYYNLPVLSLIKNSVPPTLLLLFTSTITAFIIGIFLGAVSAYHINSLLLKFITAIFIAGYAAPAFLTGMVLIIVLGHIWPLFPISGMRSIATVDLNIWWNILDLAHHLILPVTTLALAQTALFIRITRASMLTVLSSDYIRTAHAKGLSAIRVAIKHALRNALPPAVALLGVQLGNTMAAVVLVETVFNWPGMGRLALESALRRDYPTLTALLLCSCGLIILLNQAVRVFTEYLDTRLSVNRMSVT